MRRAGSDPNYTVDCEEPAIIGQQSVNEDLFRKLVDDDDFASPVKGYLRRRVYRRPADGAPA